MGPLGKGMALGSTVPARVRNGSGPIGRTSSSADDRPSLIATARPEDEATGPPTRPASAMPRPEVPDGVHGPQVPNQGAAWSGVSTAGASDGVDRVAAADERVAADSGAPTVLRGERSPESIESDAEPGALSQALLRELEWLRDQLQSSGESAIGWLLEDEVSRWLLMGLVVAVTAAVVRREVRHSRLDTQGPDGRWLGLSHAE